MGDAANHHTLTGAQFNSLAAGFGDEGAMAALYRGQLSRWLMTITSIVDSIGSELAGPPFELLARVQAERPDVFAEFVTYPICQAWADVCLEQTVSGCDESTTAAHIRRLHTLAAAAAAQARIPFSLHFDAPERSFTLPSLGRLTLPRSSGSTLHLEGDESGLLSVRTDGHPAHCLVRPSTGSVEGTLEAQWRPIRRMVLEHDELTVSLALDDLDEYRRYCVLEHEPSDRLSDSELEGWREIFQAAWTLIVERHHDYAVGIAAGLRCIVPLKPGAERLTFTNRRSFGSIATTAADDEKWLAFGMLHVFQQSKFYALQNQIPLHHATYDERRYYTPWFPRPKSLREVFEGFFSHPAAVAFWEAERDAAPDEQSRARAEVQMARWHDRAPSVRTMLRDSGEVTEWGERVLSATDAGMHKLRVNSAIAINARHVARTFEMDHRLSWRLRNLAPDSNAITRLLECWIAGQPCPLGVTIPLYIKNGSALGGYAMRNRLRESELAQPIESSRPPKTVSDLDGMLDVSLNITPGDLALARGDSTAAAQHYVETIYDDPYEVEAWAGLATTYSIPATPLQTTHLAATAFSRFPEVVMATHHLLLHSEGEFADPIALAAWISPLLGMIPESEFQLRD